MTEPTPTKPIHLGYLVRFLKPYRGLITLTSIFLLLGQGAASLDPIWLKKIIDGVTAYTTLQALVPVIATYFALRAASALFDYLRDYLFAPAEMGIAKSLSQALYDHLLVLPIRYHQEQKLGGTARKITRGGRAATFILDFLVDNILPIIVELVIVTALLFHLYTPVYAIITFLTVVLYTVFTVWATDKRQKYRLAANEADDEVSSLEVDALTNIDTVKYFNNEQELRSRYLPSIQKRYSLSVASNKLFALISAGQSGIILVGLGILLFLAIRQTVAGILTVGDLVLLTTYLTRLADPITILGFIYRQIKDGLADLDGMARIMQEEITVKDSEHPQHIAQPKGEVVFDQVSFQYNENRPVLNALDLDIKPGQNVAFVGPSGAGKSTVVRLLFRLYDPTSGHIRIDGVDLRELSKESRREIFAIVPQEPVLFNASIAENIRFGKTNATDAEVAEAVKLASLENVIAKLPEGLETVVGERGVKLSGGEKQRVAIARAIIRDPKILVFDEATSSLDTHSEQAIQEALGTIAKGRTTITVAHRLSTIVGSDVIYVLNHGGVAEAGTHQELLAKNGLYAKLWNLQIQNPEADEVME